MKSGPEPLFTEPSQWRDSCKHCMALVEEFWITDGLQEDVVDRLVIDIDGDDEDDDDDESGNEGDATILVDSY